jgi:ataxin-10
VLTTEILSTVVLAVQTRADKKEPGGGEEAMVASMKGRPGPGIIPPLVDVLAATHSFLPRIKPTPATAEENAAAAAGQMSQREIEHAFANVKRDLVRLLAVLAYNDTAVGDDVRAAGGVQLVLGLCETDERNAYLREHALFAVRNLMMGNPANQAIIAEMEPLGLVGEDGVLGPLPEKLKKSDAAAMKAGRGE